MKPSIKHLFILPMLIAILSLIPASRVAAQTFKTLHSFTGGGDGASPNNLILSGNILYGTASSGGNLDNTNVEGIGSLSSGTLFAVHTDGSGFIVLHPFPSGSNAYPYITNSDGAGPNYGVILSGNTLYGTAETGGTEASGTVFAVNTDGTSFVVLHTFTGGSDGSGPMAGVILSGSTLYGTTSLGGSSGYGTVYKVNTNGSGFTVLHSFTGGSDGGDPQAGFILSGNILYGTAAEGNSENGTMYKVNTDGTDFTVLHSFTNGSDGASPQPGLILSGSILYGTTTEGGSSSNGTFFAVNTDGMGFTVLHNFTALSAPYVGTNSDGTSAVISIISGHTLYGTASSGGSSGNGTVFRVNTDGTGFTTLYSFNGGNDGASPNNLILSGNALYGTALIDGSSGKGTVFSLMPSAHP